MPLAMSSASASQASSVMKLLSVMMILNACQKHRIRLRLLCCTYVMPAHKKLGKGSHRASRGMHVCRGIYMRG